MKHIDEFIKAAAERYAATMVEENKIFLMEEPHMKNQLAVRRAYIQKYFIENRDLTEYRGFKEIEYLTARILEYTVAIFLPDEYDMNDEFTKNLFVNDEFIQARLMYKEKYGHFPVEILNRYRAEMAAERKAAYEKLNELEREEDVENFEDVLSAISGMNRKYTRRCVSEIKRSLALN